MLLLDPAKRYTIQQVRNHEWIQADGGPPKSLPPSPVIGVKGQVGEFNEHILRLMHSNGIDQQRTIEVSLIKYFAIFFYFFFFLPWLKFK